MAVRIEPIKQHKSYKVNNHLVFKDSLDNWSSKTELSQHELNAFHNYKEAIIENKDVKKHTTSTYKGN